MNGLELNKELWTQLHPHQQNAIQMIHGYIESKPMAHSEAISSALVRMPTGTGKSGIIAILSQCLKEIAVCLVITPSDAICEQLIEDVELTFWKTLFNNATKLSSSKKLVFDEILPTKPVHRLLRSNKRIGLQLVKKRRVILIGTMQALTDIQSNDNSYYEVLKKNIDLILVDEGHREPAENWSKSVRNIFKPTVLFTATPYRNDHKVFNIDKKWISLLTFKEAVKQRFISDVKFIEKEISQTPKDFIEWFLEEISALRKANRIPTKGTKFLIRCESHTSIQDIVSELKRRGQKAIGFHDTFPIKSKNHLYQKVPNRKERENNTEFSADFWVHQWKLLEGVDIPELCVLGLFDHISNGRSIVQQIGRIIRNNQRIKGKTAYVVSLSSFKHSLIWETFLKYEESFEENPDLYDSRSLFDIIVKMMPENFLYANGKFRTRFEINKHLFAGDFGFSKNCNVFQLPSKSLNFESLCNDIISDLRKRDCDVRNEEAEIIDANSRILTYVEYFHPEHLLNDFLFQFDIGFVFVTIRDNLLYVNSSHNIIPDSLRNNYSPVYGETLQNILSDSERISQVSVINSDLGDHAIRRKFLSARSVDSTAPEIDDFMQMFSTARGINRNNEGTQSRYIGLSKGRISFPDSKKISLLDFQNWINEIHNILTNNVASSSRQFSRYAPMIKNPSDYTPHNILIDIAEDVDNFITTVNSKNGTDNIVLSWDEKCSDIQKGKFTLKANGFEYEISIVIDKKHSRYKLESKAFALAYSYRGGTGNKKPVDIIQYLNREQAFRILLVGRKEVYARGHFFSNRLNLSGRTQNNRFDLLKILQPEKKLNNISEEKGKSNANNDGWINNTVFNLIDNYGIGTTMYNKLKSADILICDDMGTEIADFIVVKKNEWIILIHAKCKKTTTYTSASSFHDLCGQALKNLDVLIPHNTEFTPPIAKWNKYWKSKKQIVKNRIRKPNNIKGKEAWDILRTTIENPSCHKSIWLVFGNGLSKQVYEKELKKRNINANVLQLTYLLQSTWASIAKIANEFKVYCGE